VSGAIEAVADPDAIRDKLSPVIPDAGMLYKLTPSPLKLPVYDPVNGVFKSLNCKDELIKVGLLSILPKSTMDAVTLVNVDPSPMNEPLNVPTPDCAKDEVIATLLVPCKLPVNDVAVTVVLTCRPRLGLIDAVALPDAICDRFNPIILLAGTLVKPAPLPTKLPENIEADIAPCTIIVLVTRKLPVMYISSPVLQ
jgi:hypothetical protein